MERQNSQRRYTLVVASLAAAAIVWATGCGSSTENQVAEQPAGAEPANPGAAQTSEKNLSPPAAPDHLVFRPEFDTTLGKVAAGSAFAIKFPGQDRPILLSAIHLLGPAGGLEQGVPSEEVSKVVKRISLRDCFDEDYKLSFDAEAITIPDARPLGTRSESGDVVAFWMPSSAKITTAKLADTAAKKGDAVWLMAAVLQGAPPTQRLHQAVVIGLDPHGSLIYQFKDVISIQATSGAPVLNAKGEVVGINLGGEGQGGKFYGGANPSARVARRLETVLNSAPGKN